jgi:predicted nucleic acid-binding protein
VIPEPDFWIAALTLQHQTRLVTMDRHFEAFPEIKPFVLFMEKVGG